MIFADTEAIHSHITIFLPEDLPGFTDILRMFGAQFTFIGDRVPVNLPEDLLRQMI
jgi:hypothetical protein